ncbi:MAG: hypothetical protein Q9209_000789 [Squamulea sp. 1 TL-2023]
MAAAVTVTVVDSLDLLVECLELLENTYEDSIIRTPYMYCAVKGDKVSRYGSVSLLQIYHQSQNVIFLIDIQVLGGKAFTVSSNAGLTLKSLLESNTMPKCFFDVRNDADALKSHFGIGLRSVQDLQLVEVASRWHSKTEYWGLSRCIEEHTGLQKAAFEDWKTTELRYEALTLPKHGGSPETSKARPLQQEIIDYYCLTILYLPILYRIYSNKLKEGRRERVMMETCKQIEIAQSPSYDPYSKDKNRTPWAQKSGLISKSIAAPWRSTVGDHSSATHGNTSRGAEKVDGPPSGTVPEVMETKECSNAGSCGPVENTNDSTPKEEEKADGQAEVQSHPDSDSSSEGWTTVVNGRRGFGRGGSSARGEGRTHDYVHAPRAS